MGLFDRLRRKQPEPPKTEAPDGAQYMTWEEYVRVRQQFEPTERLGVLVIERDPEVHIYWPSWAHWRFGKRAPEHVAFRDIEDVKHKSLDDVWTTSGSG